MGLNLLVGTSENGTSLRESQHRATTQGFDHVAKVWYDQTMSFEQGLEELQRDRSQIEDIITPLGNVRPGVTNGRFSLTICSNGTLRSFYPTPHAVTQMGNWSEAGSWLINQLLEDKLDKQGNIVYQRDEKDADTLARIIQNGFRRLNQSKPFLWRTMKDGTLRAMLSNKYAIVDNRWFLETLHEFIPGGRLSHWRGDVNTIWGNVLIPDTIRQEEDSDYGAMLSIGNSEIGERRVSSVPSVFRHICMNGCIWGQTVGQGICQVHRGKVDLGWLKLEIKTNLNKQIPLALQGIDKLLGTRLLSWDGAAEPLMAEISLQNKLSKAQARRVLRSYYDETHTAPESTNTLFGVINGVTRAAQTFDNQTWVNMDTLGGRLSDVNKDRWSVITQRAASLTKKEVEEVFK